MVWHVECQNTSITVCVGKGDLRVSVVEKAQSKPKTPKPLLFPFSFPSKTPKPTALSTIPIQTLYESVKMNSFK